MAPLAGALWAGTASKPKTMAPAAAMSQFLRCILLLLFSLGSARGSLPQLCRAHAVPGMVE
jgi:hypothetical protein